jgi:hypothetical protein
VLIKIALYGLLMYKTGLREREGYGLPTPAIKYIYVWTFDVYTVLGYLTLSSSRISSNCNLSMCTVKLQRSEDFLPMYPVAFSRAKQRWAKPRWAVVYCTSEKFSACIFMINIQRYFPICTYEICPRSVL